MTNNAEAPCRLWVFLAREANRAVVLRRGPSKWFRLSLWHTDTDIFEHGQWLKGRVYPYRSDLSPDGSLFLYFALRHRSFEGSQQSRIDGYTKSWTAISKPPYFTALALWPLHTGTWMGGGLFIKKRTIWFNGYPGHSIAPHPNHKPKRLKVIPNTRLLTGDMPVYSKRLNRDGWILQPEGAFERTNWQTAWKSKDPLVWHKASPNGRYHLAMYWVNIDYDYVFMFDVFDNIAQSTALLSDVTWADWDHQGRLVAARNGQLIVLTPDAPNLTPIVLHEFNSHTPEPVAPPEWAKRW